MRCWLTADEIDFKKKLTWCNLKNLDYAQVKEGCVNSTRDRADVLYRGHHHK